MDDLEHWGFVDPGQLRDELTHALLDGRKTATSSLRVEYGDDGDPLPRVGERSVVVDSHNRPVAIIETVSSSVVRLADVPDDHARAEGEGYEDTVGYRRSHEEFWRANLDELRREAGSPSFDINDDTEVVLEQFRLVELIADDEPQGPR